VDPGFPKNSPSNQKNCASIRLGPGLSKKLFFKQNKNCALMAFQKKSFSNKNKNPNPADSNSRSAG